MRVTAIVEDDGRIAVPFGYRGTPGLKPGDEVVLVVDEASAAVDLMAPDDPVERAQALVRLYIPADRRLADELIAERRDEARGG